MLATHGKTEALSQFVGIGRGGRFGIGHDRTESWGPRHGSRTTQRQFPVKGFFQPPGSAGGGNVTAR
jgi:hypothetical protein